MGSLWRKLSELDWSQLPIIAGLIVVAGGTVASYFRGIIKTNKDLDALEMRQNDKYSELAKLLTAFDVKVSLIWKYLELHLPDMLKRPTHLIMDALLEKFKTRTITHEETIQLKGLITELMADDMKTRREMVLPDTLMLGLIDYRLMELAVP